MATSNVPVERRRNADVGTREWRNPFRDMMRFQREIDRMFDDFWNFGGSTGRDLLPMSNAAVQPACDCEETDTHFVYNFDLPGLRKEDVKVELQENCIHVSGERKREHEEKGKGRYTSERYYGSIDRWIPLPSNVKQENVEARMENGVLQVAIPKSEEIKPKQIQIGEGKSGAFARQIEKKDEKKGTAA